MRIVRLGLACIALALATSALGCAFGEIRWSDPLQREISLEDAQHRYTVLVRWSNFEEAAAFVARDVRDDFIANAPSFRKLRFTEYEMTPLDIDDELQSATIEVTYYAYVPASPMEMEIRETQVWRREKGVGNAWFVTPTFDGMDALLSNKTAAR